MIRKPFFHEIETVIKNPDIWERINNGYNISQSEIHKHYYEFDNYIYIDDNNEINGLIMMCDDGKIHFNILPEYRNNSPKIFHEFLKECKYKKLYCEIPLCYNDVIKFAKKMNFIEKSIKNDKMVLEYEHSK